jgi:hypothetical protein
MYPDTTPSPQSSQVNPPAASPAAKGSWTGDVTLARLFGPDHVPAPGEIYPIETSSRSVLSRYENTLVDDLGYTAKERTALHRQHVADLRRTGLDPIVFGEPFYEGRVAALKAATRGEEHDPTQTQEILRDLRREQREFLGSAERAERLFAETETFLNAHPTVREVVMAPGFATSHAGKKAIGALLEHVRKQVPV